MKDNNSDDNDENQRLGSDFHAKTMAIDLELKWDRLNAWLQEDHSGYQANVIWKEVPGGY